MKIKINRREFLVALAGLGAVIALGEQPTPADVDVAWAQMLKNPWYFEVDGSGTIIEPDVDDPKINADVYDLTPADLSDAKSLIAAVNSRGELLTHFQLLHEDFVCEQSGLLEDRMARLEAERDDAAVSAAHRRELQNEITALKTQIAAFGDGSHDWQDWVASEGEAGLSRFRNEIDSWLQRPVQWSNMEWWDQDWSGQGRALSFFQRMDHRLVQEIGVVIVEGDHPGSTYFAAELRVSVEDANMAATELELPFRFRMAAG